MVRLLGRMLAAINKHGWRLLEACGGQEGLDLLATEAPDLVLLDLAMPGVSGYDILRVLHQEPRYSDIGIVLMTGVELGEDETPVYEINVQSQRGFSVLRSLNLMKRIVQEVSSRSLEG